MHFYKTDRSSGPFDNFGGFRVIDIKANRVVAGRLFEINTKGLDFILRCVEQGRDDRK